MSNELTGYLEDCCWTWIRDQCKLHFSEGKCPCRCHTDYPNPDDEHMSATKLAERAGDYIELQRRAIAVTRMWDALGQCEDEFEPSPDAACGELRDRLDIAIDGLMKMVDREMWNRRQARMREAALPLADRRRQTSREGEPR